MLTSRFSKQMDIEKQQYPIGIYSSPDVITGNVLSQWIEDISSFPKRIRKVVLDLTDEQLDTPYRQGGWTVRQVVHHCADSHMNSLMRFKLTLTEENPTIKPYLQDRWVELPDSKNAPIESSLKMLEGIHERWSILLNSFTEADLHKTFSHPEHGRGFRLDDTIGSYAWHCNHHLAHITELKKRMNW